MPIPAYTSITILTYLMALGALLQSIRITKKKVHRCAGILIGIPFLWVP